MDKQAFAACMKRNREKQGITFENLAEKTGIPIEKIIEFESWRVFAMIIQTSLKEMLLGKSL